MVNRAFRVLFTVVALIFTSSLLAQDSSIQLQGVTDANAQLRAAMRAGTRKSGVTAIAPERIDRGVLRRRAALLQQLISTRPELARNALLRPEEIASLRTVSGVPLDVVEHVHSFRGSAAVKIVDSDDWKSSLYQFDISDNTDRYTGYYAPSADTPGVGCGDSFELDGYRIGKTMLITRLRVISAAVADPVCSSIGEQQVAVILVNFPGRPAGTISQSDYRQFFFGNGSTVADYYSQGSYGRDVIHGDVCR